MKDKNVTILMCVFNGSEYIRAAIESVLNQTYQNFELIIIDDASTDDTWQIISDFVECSQQIKAIRSSVNQGAGVALNKGLQVASGQYITRQDSDDVMLPDRLAEQIFYLERFPEIGAVGTNVIFIDPQGNEIGPSSFPLTDAAIQEALPDSMCFCGPTVLIRRECFEKAGFYFVEEFATSQDYDICLRLSEVTKLANLERQLYLYRQHPKSVSISKRHRQMYNKAKALEHAIHRRYETNPPQKLIDYLTRDYLRAAILGCTHDDLVRGRNALETALSYSPNLLNSPSLEPPLEEIIRRSLPRDSLDSSVAYLERLFRDLFPKKFHLRRMRSRLLSELYMEEAFAQAQNSSSKTYDLRMIWKGIRCYPVWLANKGVISILAKQLLFHQ